MANDLFNSFMTGPEEKGHEIRPLFASACPSARTGRGQGKGVCKRLSTRFRNRGPSRLQAAWPMDLQIHWPLHPAQGHGIAEHDKVPPVLDHLKSAPLDLAQEQVAPCYALHIANLAFHDATAPRLG